MVIFHSFLYVYQRVYIKSNHHPLKSSRWVPVPPPKPRRPPKDLWFNSTGLFLRLARTFPKLKRWSVKDHVGSDGKHGVKPIGFTPCLHHLRILKIRGLSFFNSSRHPIRVEMFNGWFLDILRIICGNFLRRCRLAKAKQRTQRWG